MAIEAGIKGTRILVLNIPFRDKEAAKRIYGCLADYNKTVTPEKFIGWSFPLTMDTCYALRRTFGRDLVVRPELTAWAREELKRQSAIEEVRSGIAADLPRVAALLPSMHQAMMARPYQQIGAGFLVHGGQVVLGDDPGLGKTIQALAALVEKGASRILVCCPKTTAVSVWEKETRYWAPIISTFVAQGTHAQREEAIGAFEDHAMVAQGQAKMLIINTEMIRAKKRWQCPDGTIWKIEPGTIYKRMPHPKACHKTHGYDSVKEGHKKFVEYLWPQLYAKSWDAIVMDESHQFLASTDNYMSKNITQGRLGAVHLRRRLTASGLAAALSGTPFRSDLRKAWGTLNWLRPDVFTSYHKWAQREFDYEEDDGYGYQPDYQREPSDPAGFNERLRPYFLARAKADAAPDLPPVQFMGTPPLDNPKGLKAIWLDLTPEQEKAYQKMELDAEAEVEGGRLLATGVLAEITRKRQLASAHGYLDNQRQFHMGAPSNKIDWLIEFLLEHQGHDTKVIFGSEFTQMIELAAATIELELDVEVLTITGKVTGAKRDQAVARFQNMDDPCKIIGLNMQAGGVGITLDAADYVIEMDVPWVSDVEKQFIDRAHRVSRLHNVFVYRLLSLGTVDEWMATLSDEQRRILLSASPQAIELAREALR
jgi:SNF2 family DNA or RNA helicase